MASYEDSYSSERSFLNSRVRTLVERLHKMLRSPVIDTLLDETLDDFIEQLKESERYLAHGIFNVKFAEAGLFLQSAAVLYGKKVDLLWDSTLQYQMQLCTCSKSSEQDKEEANVIEERLNRHRRKKITIQDAKEISSLHEDLQHLCEKADQFLKGRCSALDHVDGGNRRLDELEASGSCSQNFRACSSKTVCGYQFPVNSSICVVNTEEKLCSYSDLYLNCTVPFFEASDFDEVSEDFVSNSVLCSNNDSLLQLFLREKQATYKVFWVQQLANDFEAYKQSFRQIAKSPNIRLSLDEKVKSLCPKEFVVSLPKLPDEVLSEFANSNTDFVKAYIQNLLLKEKDSQMGLPSTPGRIKKGSERISEADSFFQEEAFDEIETSTVICDNPLLTQRSSADSGIFCESLILSGVLEATEEDIQVMQIETTIEAPQNEPATQITQAEAEVPAISIPEKDKEISEDVFIQEKDEQVLEDIRGNETVESANNLESEPQDVANEINTTNIKEKIPAVPAQITVIQRNNLKPLKEPKIKENLKRKSQEDNNEKAPKKTRTVERLRLREITTASLRKFEKFFRANYQPEFEEGCVPAVEEEEEEEDDDRISTGVGNELCYDFEGEGFLGFTQNDLNINSWSSDAPLNETTELNSTIHNSIFNFSQNQPSEFDSILNDNITVLSQSEPDEFNSTIPNHNNISISTTSDFNDDVPSSSAILNPNDSTQKETSMSVLPQANNSNVSSVNNSEVEIVNRLRAVTEWKKFIEPRLEKAHENSVFDIHQYGTAIMDSIPTVGNLNFDNLVDGKPPSEVVRFFLASLQLANTYNVDLIVPQQAELANGKFELKLLSRDRYHEHLDEYEAPSENSYREKLAKVQSSSAFKSHSQFKIKNKRQRFC